jgi:hypothetical protein
MRAHSFAVGQRLSYPDSHPPHEVRKGGYEIASLLALWEREPQSCKGILRRRAMYVIAKSRGHL